MERTIEKEYAILDTDCCFCFKLLDCQDYPGNRETIYNSCNNHIKREYLSEKFLNWNPHMPLPFCKKCLIWTQKLSKLNTKLRNILKEIENCVEIFTEEFLEARKSVNKYVSSESHIENNSLSTEMESNRAELLQTVTDINFTESAIKEELGEQAEDYFNDAELSTLDVDDFFEEGQVLYEDVKPQLTDNFCDAKVRQITKALQSAQPVKCRKIKKGKRSFEKHIRVNLRRMEFDSEGNPLPSAESLPRRKAAIKADETLLLLADDIEGGNMGGSGYAFQRSESEESIPSWEESLSPKGNKLMSLIESTKIKKENRRKKTYFQKEEENVFITIREKRFKCNLCDKRFYRARHMRDHEITHDKNKRFRCALCDMSYAYSRNLRQHLKKHARGELFSDSKDKNSSEDIGCEEYDSKRSVDEERKYKCFHSRCDKTYKTKYHLSEHERTHYKEKRFQCTYCDMSYAYVRNLRDHFLKRHKKVYPRKKGGRPPGPKNDSDSTIGDLTQPKSYVCKVCGKICNTAGHLFYHRKSHLGVEGEIKCETCNKMFKNVVTLAKHQKGHTDQNRYLCSICGKEFKSKTGRRDHERFHNGEKKAEREKFECPVCHKMYSSRSSLNLHSLRHKEFKQFECPETGCSKRFSTKGGLNCHAMYHKGEKPFLCEECGKSFYTATKLKAHNRLHTGLLFPCEFCDKGFQTTTHLKQHYRSHKNKIDAKAEKIQSFPCHECMQAFSNESDLNNHLCSHTSTFKIPISQPPPDDFSLFIFNN